jgi:chloride channel 3/4/5
MLLLTLLLRKTPMTVSPQLPLEIVMQLFKRIGCVPFCKMLSGSFASLHSPRVILVEDHGALIGLVTVKDVLRFIATLPSHEPSWDDRGGLDGLLEELWKWVADVIYRIMSWSRKLVRR